MPSPLVPCPTCTRHVFARESTCPFCASSLPTDLEKRAIPGATTRLTRAAAFAFTASLAVTACSSGGDGEPSGSDSGVDTGSPQPVYGQPVVDSGNGQALYGAPAVDAGPADVGPNDDGGPAVLYGVPPPDAGGD